MPPSMFEDVPVSDEAYYVTAGGEFLKKVGVLPELPPTRVSVVRAPLSVGEGALEMDVAVGDANATLMIIPVPAGSPILPVVRPFIPVALYSLGWVAGLAAARAVVLAISLAALLVFCSTMSREYGPLIFAVASVVYFVDHVAFRFLYLLMLDSLMVSFALLSLAMFVAGRDRLSLLFLCLSAASKEQVLLFVSPAYFLYWLFGERNPRKAMAYLALPIASCVASYALNAIYVPPDALIPAAVGTLLVSRSVCRDLYLLGLYREWGLFSLFTPFVWVWLPSVVAYAVNRRKADRLSVVYAVALFNVASVMVVSLVRSVYNFYYATAVALSPVALSEMLALAGRFKIKLSRSVLQRWSLRGRLSL